jgi:NADH-quinone oxidoreductase subunit C
MTYSAKALATRLSEKFGTLIETCETAFGEVTITVPCEKIFELCLSLRDEKEFSFAQLIDLCGVDYLSYGEAEWQTSTSATTTGFSRGVDRQRETHEMEKRFAVIYHLLSITNNQRLRVKTFPAGNPPKIASVIDIWSVANWFEREAFDLYGILFEGHPDLRRLLTDYGFIGHPFRKDFPLIGNVEMRYDAEKRRVVYEPVSIEERTLVPRVIRDERTQPVTADGDQ